MLGRKSKYTTHIEPAFEVILGYLRIGMTEKSIAKSLGVGVTSWKKYKTQFPAFTALLKKGALDATALVVNALYKRATGYEYDEKYVEERNVNGIVATVVKQITKHVPPDTAACIFWLINHDPDHWRNRQDIKHSGEIRGTGVLLIEPPKTKEGWLELHEEVEKYQKSLESEYKNKLIKSNILEAGK